MVKRIKIEVSQEDIDMGARNRVACCPIARAMRRNGLGCPQVGYGYAVWENGTGHLPESAQRFMRKFDREGPTAVEPFRFYLKPEE